MIHSFSIGSGIGGLHAGQNASIFAADLGRRIASRPATIPQEDLTPSELSQNVAAKNDELKKLEGDIAGAVSFISDKFGQAAGTAAMGLMYKRLGANDQSVTEQTLGEAFLDVTRLLDKQFGTKAGDQFLSHLNSTVNDSMNEYFDNGLNEEFMAVTPEVLSKLAESEGTAIDGSNLAKTTETPTDAIVSLIESAREAAQNTDGTLYAQAADKSGMIGVTTDIMV